MNRYPPIVFFGTPEFAAGILDHILVSGIPVRGVVTAPDKPAGRGRKPQPPAVKIFALEKNIPLLQPEKLKDPAFLDALSAWQPALQVVVAFRMLPEAVWAPPCLGTFNLHASLLPQYRGAAPIQHVLLNGEKETGVTTFFIDHQIDTGRIIMQEKVLIDKEDNAGTLAEKLMRTGGQLTVKTIEAILRNEVHPVEQHLPEGTSLKKAPKITKQDLTINWQRSPEEIYNHIRAFSPLPGARTLLYDKNGKPYVFKIFSATTREETHTLPVPSLISDGKTHLDIAIPDGFLSLKEIQLEGRKRMDVKDFLRGFRPDEFTFSV
jgi:methionyl-tRNA formyltransferase